LYKKHGHLFRANRNNFRAGEKVPTFLNSEDSYYKGIINAAHPIKSAEMDTKKRAGRPDI